MDNLDPRTVEAFGEEWTRFDQRDVPISELEMLFQQYFSIFPWETLGSSAAGFDAGCGSGRWARFVAPRVGKLHCIDASAHALAVARNNLSDCGNCRFHLAPLSKLPLPDGSMDFGYSLGVLHHVPDPPAALRCCVEKLKLGAPFLIYVYYAFDNRPLWFRFLWRLTDVTRRLLSRAPGWLRHFASDLIATVIYWPLSRMALLIEALGKNPEALPLASYRRRSFYSMRTDSLDRFGTPLEHRFSAAEVETLMTEAGLSGVVLGDSVPYWRAVGFRSS